MDCQDDASSGVGQPKPLRNFVDLNNHPITLASIHLESLPAREKLAFAKLQDSQLGKPVQESALAACRSINDWAITGQGWLPDGVFGMGVGHGNIGQLLVNIAVGRVSVAMFPVEWWLALDEAEQSNDERLCDEAWSHSACSEASTAGGIDDALMQAVEAACNEQAELFISDDEMQATAEAVAKLVRKNLNTSVRQRIERGGR